MSNLAITDKMLTVKAVDNRTGKEFTKFYIVEKEEVATKILEFLKLQPKQYLMAWVRKLAEVWVLTDLRDKQDELFAEILEATA